MRSPPIYSSNVWLQEGARLLNATHLSDKYQQHCPTKSSICFKNCMKALGRLSESFSWLHGKHPEKTRFGAQLQRLNCVIMHISEVLLLPFHNGHPFAVKETSCPRPWMFSREARNLEYFLWEDRDYSPDTEAMMYRFSFLPSDFRKGTRRLNWPLVETEYWARWT